MKTFFGVKLIEENLRKARELGLKLGPLFNAALAKAIHDKRCPYCNQKLEEK